jgi:polysaccharide deacetylase 2 family uncharacterized protein YibQ
MWPSSRKTERRIAALEQRMDKLMATQEDIKAALAYLGSEITEALDLMAVNIAKLAAAAAAPVADPNAAETAAAIIAQADRIKAALTPATEAAAANEATQ